MMLHHHHLANEQPRDPDPSFSFGTFSAPAPRFEHSPELASTVKSMKSMADSSLQASASRVFAETEDNRTKLGMKGNAVEGIKGDLVADTFREKMSMTGAMAAPGPIKTAITEKVPKMIPAVFALNWTALKDVSHSTSVLPSINLSSPLSFYLSLCHPIYLFPPFFSP
jgi:hypothetical protein